MHDVSRRVRRWALPYVLRMRQPQTELGPDRLYAFLDAIWQRRHSEGDVLEIGCFRGGTARLGYRFLQSIDSPQRYVAVDTFAGFVDRQFEHDRRHGTAGRFRDGFAVNDIHAVRESLRAAGCGAVELVEGDISALPSSALPSKIAVCLLDVDLELPTYEALRRVVPRLAPGGIVLVDDCDPRSEYAGARVGYRRFVEERALPEECFMAMGIVRQAESISRRPPPA